MNWRFWDKSGHDNCAAIEPLLSLYSDDMASQSEKRRVEAHLPECPKCRQALDWMQATRQVISLRPSLVPPGDLRARIARAIAEADAAKVRPTKAPAVPVPARRPLSLRPALAYGLSLALFAGVAGDIFWNAEHPTHPQVAKVSPVPHPASRLVAANTADPHTSAVIDSVLGHFNQTLHRALIVSPHANAGHLAVRTAHARIVLPGVLRAAPPQEQELPRLAIVPHTTVVPHLTPTPHKLLTVNTHMAAKPHTELPALAPKPTLPATHDDNQQVASANVPHEESHAPTVAVPVPATISPATHDNSQVAEHVPSTREVLSQAMASMHTVAYRSSAKVLNSATYLATADSPMDHSGTVSFVSGPVH